jgi:hypothetical protein
VDKKFIVTVILDDNTMDKNHYCFQVKFTEYMTDAALLAPLPLNNAKHIDPTATGPPTEPTPREQQKLLSREHEV